MFWNPGLLEFLMRLRATMFTLRLDRAVPGCVLFLRPDNEDSRRHPLAPRQL
jgi:hypothetical protein